LGWIIGPTKGRGTWEKEMGEGKKTEKIALPIKRSMKADYFLQNPDVRGR